MIRRGDRPVGQRGACRGHRSVDIGSRWRWHRRPAVRRSRPPAPASALSATRNSPSMNSCGLAGGGHCGTPFDRSAANKTPSSIRRSVSASSMPSTSRQTRRVSAPGSGAGRSGAGGMLRNGAGPGLGGQRHLEQRVRHVGQHVAPPQLRIIVARRRAGTSVRPPRRRPAAARPPRPGCGRPPTRPVRQSPTISATRAAVGVGAHRHHAPLVVARRTAARRCSAAASESSRSAKPPCPMPPCASAASMT